MMVEESGAWQSKRARAHRVSGRLSPTAASLLVSLGSAASCTVWPLAQGHGVEPRDAASEEQAPQAEAAPPEAPACADDPECAAPTPYCVAGVCASYKAIGSACAAPLECPNGHCVDGVCCSAAACPACEACGSAGSCAPASTGTSCTTAHASASVCDGQGTCGETECEPGYLDCDGSPSDGCETAIGLAHCGGCGVVFSPEHVTVALCSASDAVCTYAACSPGYLDCDGDKTNGCETPVGVSNCGTCGSTCQPANAIGPVCSPSGGCGYTSCAPFGTGGSLYLDCDGNTANGCESSPSAASTCGGCGNQCGAAFYCDQTSPGVYGCVHE
jgi:hypothetical protein